jgi:alpha-beta hydrolase superfamily lysophospholipase
MLSVPTLFLKGERDVFVRPKVEKAWEAIAAGNPNVHVVGIPDAGHLPWIDDPERVVAEIVRFLTMEPRSGAEAVPQSPPRSTARTAKANATA